ncbi:MAG: GNAT family N-acetyltransferase [Bacteroidota bacterium]
MQPTKTLSIREALPEDAAAILAYVDQVAGETNFLTFGQGEFTVTIEQEERLLKHYQQSDNQIFILALREAQIVGMLNVHASHKTRLRHIGEFGMSVLKAHWGQGIGSALLSKMIDWAKSNPSVPRSGPSLLTQCLTNLNRLEAHPL